MKLFSNSSFRLHAAMTSVAAIAVLAAVQTASAQSAQVYVPLAQPCRLADTRVSSGGPGPLTQAHGNYQFFATDAAIENTATQNGSATGCGIPAGVTAISADLNMLNATASGNIRAWSDDQGTIGPNVGVGVYNPSVASPQPGQAIYNPGFTTIAVGADRGFYLSVANGQIDMTINVVGYWTPLPAALASLGQGLTWGTLARNTIGNATAQLRNDASAQAAGLGSGSLQLTVGLGGGNAIAGYTGDKIEFGDETSFAGQLIANLTAVSYWVKTTGENIAAASGGANMPSIAIEVFTTGSGGYSTLNYSPTVNSTAGAWSFVDAVADTSNAWGLTGSAFNSPANSANCGINGPRCTFAQVKTLLTTPPYNAKIISVAIGKGRDFAWNGQVDRLRINGTTYDFEFGGVVSIPTP